MSVNKTIFLASLSLFSPCPVTAALVNFKSTGTALILKQTLSQKRLVPQTFPFNAISIRQMNSSKDNSVESLDDNPLRGTSKQVNQTLDPCVILMKQIASKYEHKWAGEGIYSLAQGVVYWKPPQEAYDKVLVALKESNDLHQYCPDEGLPELVDALKTKLQRENNLPPSDSHSEDAVRVIVTSGANQAYMNCVLTFLGEGDKCVIFKPYYFNHVMAVQMTRGDDALVFGPIDSCGMPSIDWLEDQLRSENEKVNGPGKIKMVTIVNPGNPTGVSLPYDHLKRVVDLCEMYGVWVVMDNTYEQFDHIRANPHLIGDSDDIAGYHCFHDEHVVNIFSFSKGYAMAGFRVGYIAVNSSGNKGKDAYEQMLKVQDTIPICASRISQTAALGSLYVGRGWVSEKVKTLETGRQAILKALSPLEKTIGGTGAMYVMAKLPDGKNDMTIAEELVEKHGVVVIPGSFCGFPGWIRVCYSNLSPDDCTIAAERLAMGIAELCHQI